MINWSTCTAVERDPQRVSGAWVFRGTRVPVAALFENLEDGAQVSQFVQWFPGVSLEQVRAVRSTKSRPHTNAAGQSSRTSRIPARAPVLPDQTVRAPKREPAHSAQHVRAANCLTPQNKMGLRYLSRPIRTSGISRTLARDALQLFVLTSTSWLRIQNDITAVVRAVHGASPGSYAEVQIL